MPSEQKYLVQRFSTAGDEQPCTSITVELQVKNRLKQNVTTLEDTTHQDKISIQHDT